MSAASKTKKYDVVPTDVRRMTKLHTAAGDIKFTSLMKLIYSYIWTFQENENRGNDDPIHTNTDVIAWEMGVSEKALIDAIKALDAAKVVIKQTVKVRGNVKSSNYVAIPPASVVALGVTPPKPGNGKVSNSANKKSEEKKGNGHKEAAKAETPQAESANQPADTPTGQSAGTDGNNAGNLEQQTEDSDPTFPPEKKDPADRAGLDVLPWEGGAFEGSGRLSENAYQWALTAGATDWRHACCLVWDRVRVTPPDEINEDRKPLSLC